tara:strand:- start:9069 stop:9329 length:261 start_codon:yes stop_codon:yes gene_type:complete
MEMPAIELDQWRYFHSVEPIGYDVENWREGTTTASLFNALLKLKEGEALAPQDFFPPSKSKLQPIEPPKPASAESLRNLFAKLKTS